MGFFYIANPMQGAGRWLGLVLGCLLICGCASGPEPAPAESLTVQRIRQVPGVSRAVLFERAKQWLKENFSELDLIRLANRRQGIIVAKTRIPHHRENGFGVPDDNGELRFTTTIEVKPQRVRITFSEMYLQGFYYSSPAILASDMTVLTPQLEAMIKSLTEQLSASGSQNW